MTEYAAAVKTIEDYIKGTSRLFTTAVAGTNLDFSGLKNNLDYSIAVLKAQPEYTDNKFATN